MARSVEHDPLHVFRFHAQWEDGGQLHDLSLSEASFIGMNGITGAGNITLQRALYKNDDALLRFLETEKEVRLFLHVYHATSGYDEKKQRWTDPALTIEFGGIIPSAARFHKRVDLDASKSDVLQMRFMLNYKTLRFHRGNADEMTQPAVSNTTGASTWQI